jgi:hypothetical protein
VIQDTTSLSFTAKDVFLYDFGLLLAREGCAVYLWNEMRRDEMRQKELACVRVLATLRLLCRRIS